jgi:hypothetical protein
MNAFTDAIARATEKGWPEGAKRMEQERRMASALVRACLARGYRISVHNGEELAIRGSKVYRDVMDALWQTDEETVHIYGPDGKRAGAFFLVYGNSGPELVGDYTDNEVCNEVWTEVLRPLGDRMEEGR